MKTRSFLIGGTILLIVALAFGPMAMPVQAEDPDPKEEAIAKGLAYLADAQYMIAEGGDGGWEPGGWCDRVAYTGLALLKLETRAIELGLDPLSSEYPYAANVQEGLDFIMANQHTMGIGMQPAGNPDADADGIGVYWDSWPDCGGWHYTYNTSIALMAIVASQHPEYSDVAQDALDFLAWGQVDEGCDVHRGGWRYTDNSCDSDNSNTGWVTLALGYAQAPPPWGFGLTIPPFVLSELNPWLDIIQNDMDGGWEDGGSDYTPYGGWTNILKTGNLIYEFGLVGDNKDSPRLQDALHFIESQWTNWIDPGWGQPNNPSDYHAMFTTMKGLEALGIDLIDLDFDGVPEHDWYQEFVGVLIAQQNGDGSWPGWCNWGNDVACTAWALMTLEKAVPVLRMDVPIDVKPMSCPNPFNMGDKGTLSVAFVGTPEFDVTQVDPASVKLYWEDGDMAILPLRWALEDVATPFEPYVGKPLDAYACTLLGMDGYMDFTFKYASPALANILAGVTNGDVILLHMIGNLKEEFGGTPIYGEDVVRIKMK